MHSYIKESGKKIIMIMFDDNIFSCAPNQHSKKNLKHHVNYWSNRLKTKLNIYYSIFNQMFFFLFWKLTSTTFLKCHTLSFKFWHWPLTLVRSGQAPHCPGCFPQRWRAVWGFGLQWLSVGFGLNWCGLSAGFSVLPSQDAPDGLHH